MCNSRSKSQTWLVRDKQGVNNGSKHNLKKIEQTNLLECNLQKYCQVKSRRKLKRKTNDEATITSGVCASNYRSTRVQLCSLNQIIEVLVTLLLANCALHAVAHIQIATAAFGGTYNNDAARYYSSQYRSSRYAHSNDDRGGGNNIHTAFGYNSLEQLTQDSIDDDYQPANQLHRSQNFKISPKPCSIGRIEGTCMFVWECIKSEGRHVGMCVDSFMFGSCCAHNYTDNIVLPQVFSYTRPTKPVGISSLNHKPRPPPFPHKPSISGMTTIERPHGAGTLVIRPSGPHHQGALHKPQFAKPTQTSTTTTTNSLWSSNVGADMQSAAASVSSSTSLNTWNTLPQHLGTSTTMQHHWHMTTEPNFITKPRPPNWEKPTPLRPKPSKPTKKPIIAPEQPMLQQTPPSSIVYTTRPQHTQQTQPTYITQTHSRPTVNSSSESFSSSTSNSIQTISSSSTTNAAISSTTQKYQPITTQMSTVSANTPQKATQRPSSTTQLYTTPTRRPISSTFTSTTMGAGTSTIASSSSTSSLALPSSSSSSSTATATALASSSSTTSISSSSATATATSATTIKMKPTAESFAATISHTLPVQNLTAIESNEIADTTAESTATIKTISAARSECGIPVLARPETRIVGGKSATFGRWPWQVSVRRTSFFGFSSTHRCGGALINENWIATAGHCVDDLLISQIRIRVGEYDFSHVQEQLPYIERGVSKKVVHPKYNFFTYEYDLALVKLEQPLEFAPHVSPICLPQTDSLLIGMNATVTGWGRLSEGGTLPSVLQEVSVPIVSNDNCKTMFLRAGRQEFIPEIFLCAGYETGGQDSCQGDSGGPLQVKSQDGRFFLAGIISWGIGCAEANLPGVCTRISKFVPWILENVT
ncbi:serine proteinase stubble [Teleopsis dalmanni]|uniref:serine proteinase stubble n=1 Tax=Teleopsis dalmanni TaxID=139649 RepID=UPI0018CF96BF|nr:serine proteinase stubble [Teleopsis dalmanni]